MKRTSEQLRDELAAAKRELRRLQCRERSRLKNTWTLVRLLGGRPRDTVNAPWLQSDVNTMPPDAEVDHLLWSTCMDIVQARLLEVSDAIPDVQLNALFELAVFEFARAQGRLPGAPSLETFAKAHAERLQLPSKVKVALNEYRARQYLSDLRAMIDTGYHDEDDFVHGSPPAYLEDMACGRPQILPEE